MIFFFTYYYICWIYLAFRVNNCSKFPFLKTDLSKEMLASQKINLHAKITSFNSFFSQMLNQLDRWAEKKRCIQEILLLSAKQEMIAFHAWSRWIIIILKVSESCEEGSNKIMFVPFLSLLYLHLSAKQTISMKCAVAAVVNTFVKSLMILECWSWWRASCTYYAVHIQQYIF